MSLLTFLLLWTLIPSTPSPSNPTSPYIGTHSEDGLVAGVFVLRELAPGFDLQLPTVAFPILRGLTEEEQIANLQTDLHAVLDTTLATNGVTQRVRVKVLTVTPTTTFRVCVMSRIFGLDPGCN